MDIIKVFLYDGSSGKEDVKYWKCQRNYECNVLLKTVNTGRNLLIRKGGKELYASKVRVIVHHPQTVINDFKMAIIISLVTHFGEDVVR